MGIQSFFTWISLDKGDYQYCVLKRQGLPDWCQSNPSNDQCQGTTSEVRPEWNTQVDRRLSTINRVLTGLSTAWLRENVNENMTCVWWGCHAVSVSCLKTHQTHA